MKKLKPEIYINQKDLEKWKIDNSRESESLLPLLFVYFLIISSLLILLFSDTDIEIPRIKINIEHNSLVLFYANILLLANSLLSGGFATMTDADILEAVGRVPITQIATDAPSHLMNSMILANPD
ncbi:MAG TPA: hypothetical protein PKJ26_02140 [Candidatus Woesebacteria bacterium]|nr:hypothetical protein [Candidatus Woesebacteria bacterium]HNS65275.1 hypothetical protein [Candidatus Woesebacteria bacterium]